MKNIKSFCFFFLLTNLLLLEAFAQRQVVFDTPNKALSIGREIEIFEDKSALLTFDEVSKRPDIGAYFRRSLQKSPNFGVSSSVIWARVTLQNRTSQSLYLEIAEATIDSIAFYRINNHQVSSLKSGAFTPVENRGVKTNFYLLDLALPAQETCTYYLRFQSTRPLSFPLRVAPLKVYFEDNHPKDIMQGIYFGIMLVMAIFNFFIFFTVRSKAYLYYVIYVLSFASFFAFNKGFINEFVWLNITWINRLGAISISFGISFGLLFANSFLEVKKYLPISIKISRFLIALVIILVIAYWLGLGKISIVLLNVVVFFIVVYVLLIATFVWLKGSEEALFFLGAWSIMLVSALIFIMQLSNILPSDNFTRNALQVGSALEVVLLSFALAHRINKDRKEKERYQAEVILQLQANDQMRNRIARDLHDDIGSTLSSIGILSQVVESQIDSSSLSLKKLVSKISESSQKVQRSLSDIVWTTKQTDEGLDSVIVKMKEFTAEILEPKNIDYTFSVTEITAIQFPPLKQYNIYLIFKEAVNNSVKYAQASSLEIAIYVQEDHFVIIVKDNGVGFDENNIKQGNGLNNIRERAKAMNGSVQILTKPSKGTLIELKVPLNLK